MATKVDSNQLTDYWEDAATQTLPDYSGQTSTGFAQDGNPVTGQKATLPGAAWFNIMAAVRVSVILAAGKTPSNPPDPLQFLEALQSLGWMTSESVKTDVLADESVTTEKLADHVVTIAKIATALLATKSQAEAGTADDVLMTPQRVAQAIKALVKIASETEAGIVKVTGDDGITINGSGEIAVDFSQMPTNKFEDLLKTIRVPIWLTANKSFYVNGETGSDTLDDGRGLSASKPFKTISACVKYVTDTYNISSYILYITVAPGVYTERLQLGQYSATTGYINLRAQEQGTVTIQNLDDELTIATVSNSTWYIQNFTFDLKLSSANLSSSRLVAAAIHAYTASNVNCQNITLRAINSTEAPATVGQLRLFRCDSGGRLELYQNVSVEFSGFDEESSVQKNILYCGTDAVIALPASGSQYTFSIKGNYGTFLYVTSGTVQIGTNGQPYVYQFSLSSDVPTDGKKFSLINSSKIITNSLGLDYLPGSTAGTIQESTYCFYS